MREKLKKKRGNMRRKLKKLKSNKDKYSVFLNRINFIYDQS